MEWAPNKRDKGGTQGRALKICGLYRHTVLHFTDNAFFAHIVATLHQSSVSVPFFQWYLLISCLHVTFR